MEQATSSINLEYFFLSDMGRAFAFAYWIATDPKRQATTIRDQLNIARSRGSAVAPIILDRILLYLFDARQNISGAVIAYNAHLQHVS